MKVVEEIITKSKEYKAEIIKRNDGLFSIRILKWYEDEWFEAWSKVIGNISVIDTKKNAIEIAIEKLSNLSGEDISFYTKN